MFVHDAQRGSRCNSQRGNVLTNGPQSGSCRGFRRGSEERDDSDLSSFVQGAAPWRKRPLSNTTPTHLTTSVRRLTPPTASSGSVASSSTREEPVDDLGGNETHDEAYHRLRICMGVAEETEPLPRSSKFSSTYGRGAIVPFKWGEANLIVRLGQFLRVVGHLLEDVGYLCELREPGVQHSDKDGGEEVTLMQAFGAPQPDRGRDSSSPGEAMSIRGKDLTAEELAILRTPCPEGKDKLLSALCVLIQEVVEDNDLNERFKGWAKRWGTCLPSSPPCLQNAGAPHHGDYSNSVRLEPRRRRCRFARYRSCFKWGECGTTPVGRGRRGPSFEATSGSTERGK